MTNIPRCTWVTSDPLYMQYHDTEWGVPIYDDTRLFEFLILEGMQAGLSWLTVLKKRDAFRLAFDHFNAKKIAKYDEKKIQSLLENPHIIRNQLKIRSAITNAQSFLIMQKKHGTFSNYIWQFVNGEPQKNHRQSIKHVPTTTPESDAMSKQLKKDGFKFVGSTICYAFMQAVGMVDDHIQSCFLSSLP